MAIPEKQNIKKYHFKNELNLQVEIVDLENLVQNSAPFLTVPHRTDFYHIFIFQNCNPIHSIDFETIEIQPFSLLFLDKDRVHQFDKNLNYKGKILIFTEDFFCVNENDLKFLRSSILFNDLFDQANVLVGEGISQFFQICEWIEKELNTINDALSKDIIKNCVHNFLLLAERKKRQQGFKAFKKSADLDYTLLFKDLLEQNFSQIKNVSQYADKMAISEKRLNQALSKILGKNPKEMIDERVLLEAKRLLVHTNLSIKEIAYKLGFEEPTNFIKYFRKHTQSTPTEFREQYL
ncbi:MAG: AraC family transcriptional regulator [Cytophagales bacterium]|nr:MAG: AraC family transcriptional regulator [Cytophagales bacterium]